MSNIKVAIVGLGNCASSLIQGVQLYRGKNPADVVGIMHWDIGGYQPGDIDIVAAFDIDKRKVGQDISEAIFAEPNCTTVFFKNVSKTGVIVQMGKVLDGFSEHMKQYEPHNTFIVSDEIDTDLLNNQNLPVNLSLQSSFHGADELGRMTSMLTYEFKRGTC